MRLCPRAFCRSVALTLCAAVSAAAQSGQSIDPSTIVRDWTIVGRHAVVVDSGGVRFVRFDETAGAGMARTSSVDFGDGEIELDVRGRDVFQKSFVGVAIHVSGDTAFDAIYLRPFNFRSADSARHAHALQYTSYPEFSWEKLRADRPGRYEAPVAPDLDPNAWIHLRIVTSGRDLEVFVNRAPTPTLHVQMLGARTHGGMALWVGDLSPGDFANVIVRRR